MTVSRLPNNDGGIQPTILTAKGDLLTATAASTIKNLPVGANDQILVADSTQSTGMAWKSYGAQGMLVRTLSSMVGWIFGREGPVLQLQQVLIQTLTLLIDGHWQQEQMKHLLLANKQLETQRTFQIFVMQPEFSATQVKLERVKLI